MEQNEIKLRYSIVTKLMNNKLSRIDHEFITQLVLSESIENLIFAEQLINTLAI